MMFGYACDETPELMPFPIQMAHSLVKYLAKIRKGGEASFIRPDSKSQVTVQYREGRPVRVQSVVVSTQHAPDVQYSKLRETVIDGVIRAVIPADYLDKSTVFHVNPTGRFVVGGPQGDCGLTGRKIIVDTYWGMGRHGGGAFSGKDPSKVDRSAAYMAHDPHLVYNSVDQLYLVVWSGSDDSGDLDAVSAQGGDDQYASIGEYQARIELRPIEEENDDQSHDAHGHAAGNPVALIQPRFTPAQAIGPGEAKEY